MLHRGLQGARALRAEDAEAQMRHQLGSLALCLGERETAASELAQALQLRERLGDHTGAELTRHNLNQLEGGPPSGGNGKRPSGPHWPPRPMTLGILATVVAALIAVGVVLGVSSDGSHSVSAVHATSRTRASTAPVAKPPTPPPNQRPAINVVQPAKDATYAQQAVITASYVCTPAQGTHLLSCSGTVPDGQPIDTTAGTHRLEVTAKDSDGMSATFPVTYTVTRDTTRPLIEVFSPKQNAITRSTAPSSRGSGAAILAVVEEEI